MFLVSAFSGLCAIFLSQVLSGEWRCSWSSADRGCSNYIWVIDNLIAYQGASYIRDLMVYVSASPIIGAGIMLTASHLSIPPRQKLFSFGWNILSKFSQIGKMNSQMIPDNIWLIMAEWVSEWLSLTVFFGTVDIGVHLVHASHVIIVYTSESLSSLT